MIAFYELTDALKSAIRTLSKVDSFDKQVKEIEKKEKAEFIRLLTQDNATEE